MAQLRTKAVNQTLTEILAAEIQRSYPVSVMAIKPAGAVWKVYSSSGRFALKGTQKSPGQLQQLAATVEFIRKAGFPNLVSIIPTKSGGFFMTSLHHNYILSPWLEGQNPDFSNRRHLQMVAALWGKLHGISQPLITRENFSQESILDEWQGKARFLRSLTDELAETKHRNRIDRAIQRWIFHFIRLADFCIEQLAGLENAPEFSPVLPWGFCHNDPAPRNIIMQNEKLSLIDFELALPGPCIKELAKLITRSLQINHWDSTLFNLLTKAYSVARSLTHYEAIILPYLCAFPNGFWRLCSQRFQEQLPWTEKRFQKRLWEITTMEPDRLNCLRSMLPELPEMAD